MGKIPEVFLFQKSEDCPSSISDKIFPQQEEPDKKKALAKYLKPLLLYFTQKYVFIAFGSIVTLLILYGIDQIIKLTGIDFPASVCLMLIVFFILSFVSWLKGEQFTEKYLLRYIDIPFGFNLRWMNLYFTPPFVTLVLADKVSVKEAFIIAAVFVVGYILGFAFVGYFVWVLQILLGTYDHTPAESGADVEAKRESMQLETPTEVTGSGNRNSGHSGISIPATSIEQDSYASEDVSNASDNTSNASANISTTLENTSNALDGLNALAGLNASDNLKLSDHASNSSDHSPKNFEGKEFHLLSGLERTLSRAVSKNDVQGEQFDEGLALSRMTTRNTDVGSAVIRETNVDPAMVEKLTLRFDFTLYLIIFIVGLPVYFCTGYELLVQLSVAILLFKACLLPPPKVKKYLHPILVSFSLSLLVFYILSLIKKQNFKVSIEHYKTGRTYLNLFNKSEYPIWPGAGDFLLSMMDISIAALSLAMYRYRGDLKRYFFALMPVVIVFSFMSFFIYPPVCYHLGISPSRSLGFTGRSVTMALGTPLVHAIGGSNQLMAVTTILSGILGVFLGDWISFTLLRIRKSDFVSRGVTLGVNCGAVSTAHLLSVDPRAAAMSSLSFTLFGTIMVILAAITPLVKIIRSLVGW